jgi:hypothetical protein
MNAIVVEEHPVDTVTGSQHSLGKFQGRQTCLTGIGGTLYHYGEIHPSADTKKPRHETHGRACLRLNILIAAKSYKM